jgi:mono/diheme cytochrome c family protein
MRAPAAPILALTLLCAACGGAGSSGGALVRAGSGGGEPPFPVRLTPRQARGRTVFVDKCASCHGVDGRGDSTATRSVPDLSAKRYATLSSAHLAARYRAAHAGGLQPAVSGQDAAAALLYLPVLAYPPDSPGSALNGRRLYARYCTSCHGVRGDGQGPAATLLDKWPSDFTRDTLVADRDFAALARVIRDGPGHPHVSSMPAWGTFFNDKMLQDVAAYLPTFQAAPATTSGSSRSGRR